jgi:hypothetical protein
VAAALLAGCSGCWLESALAIPGVGLPYRGGPGAALGGAAVRGTTGGVVGGSRLGIPESRQKALRREVERELPVQCTHMEARKLIGQRTFSKLPALRISALSAKHRRQKLDKET